MSDDLVLAWLVTHHNIEWTSTNVVFDAEMAQAERATGATVTPLVDFAMVERKDAEIRNLQAELDGLRAQYEERTAYTVIHRGQALVCSDAMRQAYSGQIVRAERAEARIADAPVAKVRGKVGELATICVSHSLVGQRVALVVVND